MLADRRRHRWIESHETCDYSPEFEWLSVTELEQLLECAFLVRVVIDEEGSLNAAGDQCLVELAIEQYLSEILVMDFLLLLH